ncbi:hypothetical protein ACF0H5_016989 [Mactra antiquata]
MSSPSITCPVCSTRHVPVKQSGTNNGVQAAMCVQCGHFFKFRSVPSYKTNISFKVNGQTYTVGPEYSPSTVLNSYLRDQRISIGTKHMCYEGGCGTCLVEVKLYEPISKDRLSYAVNSCLLPLYSCDGLEIRTIEYIGNIKKGLHPIQKQIATYNGSQCGYCTPGQVMNMFALTEYYGKDLTKKQVEDSFDGVICRCTGYRPILEAFKDMAIPQSETSHTCDIEDIGRVKKCCKTDKPCSGTCQTTSIFDDQQLIHLVFADSQWFKPTTQEEITSILDTNKGKKIMFLVGNTAKGVYGDIGPDNYDVIIDLSGFKEIYDLAVVSNLIILGAGLTLTNVVDIFTRLKQKQAYFGELADFLARVANLPVRNRGTLIGNLCLIHKHNDFPSDVYVLLQVLKAKIITGFNGESIDINDFLTTDITGKFMLGCAYMDLNIDSYEVVKFYKISKRNQNAHGYVTGGFRVKLDQTNKFVILEPPVIVYVGLSATFHRATKTETYLNGKNLGDTNVLKTAISTLSSEIVVDSSPVLSSVEFRHDLALALFYKFVLHVIGDEAGFKYRSGQTQLYLDRPISSGQQTYDTNKTMWPVTEPVQKIEANAQACGEAEYVDDIPSQTGQLEAAFVLSTVGNATIESIDSTDALKIPGVIKVITSKDIPGENNWMMNEKNPAEVLASSKVEYCGQPVAIVIAEDYGTALGAVYSVKVSYSNIKQPIVTLEDGIKQQSYFPNPCQDKIVGDPETAIANSPVKVNGTISIGTQYHFHMETQSSLCIPTEDGMNVFTGTQWIDLSQTAISRVTGLNKNSINVQVKRLGGAYGGKIVLNSWIAAACGLSAYITNRPVKFRLTLGDNMKMMGKRFPYKALYQIGCTDEGKLNGIKLQYFGDCGYMQNINSFPAMQHFADNGALAPIFIMESMMEHVAKATKKDPLDIRMLNIYTDTQTDPLTDMALTNCELKQQIALLQANTEYNARKQKITTYNQNNRWKKKGISLVPLKYGITWSHARFGCQVSIYNSDGTVVISHGGIEIGQGINTKVAQVCSYELGIALDMIQVVSSNSFTTSNGGTTGGSRTSEICCSGIIECCKILNDRMAPVKEKMKDPTWVQLINECYSEGIDLTARYWTNPEQTAPFMYYSYGATIAEVDLDVLTGEHQLTRVDILFDCGESTNPTLDVGQVEGAFVMGLGYWLTEECKYDPQIGALLTDSTWEYKPPSSKDIPVDFRVNLVKKNPNPNGILGAKASGEPPLCMSCSALFALKRAIESARHDAGVDNFFPLNGPATVEASQQLCLNDPSQFVLI